MPVFSRMQMPAPAFGMTSMVLGVVALLLFFLPVLGIPLSLAGLGLGLIALIGALTPMRTNLRWAIAGLGTSCLALALNVAITQAPAGYLRDPNVPRSGQPAPNQPFAPPPAIPKAATEPAK